MLRISLQTLKHEKVIQWLVDKCYMLFFSIILVVTLANKCKNIVLKFSVVNKLYK